VKAAGTILLAQDSTISKGVTFNKVCPLRTYFLIPRTSRIYPVCSLRTYIAYEPNKHNSFSALSHIP